MENNAKHFTIHRYWVCKLSNEVMAQISFIMKDKLVTLNNFYPSVEFAKADISQDARQWFLQVLEDYINHKRQIITAAHPEQMEALNKCWGALVDFEKFSLEKIISQFQKGFPFFEKILPHENNASHQSSVTTLNELKKFCDSFTKTILQ